MRLALTALIAATLSMVTLCTSGCFRLFGVEVGAELDGSNDDQRGDGALGDAADGAFDSGQSLDVDGRIDSLSQPDAENSDADVPFDALLDAISPDVPFDALLDAISPDADDPIDAHSLADTDVPLDGDIDQGSLPIRELPLATGYWHTCALLDAGSLRCWGSGSEGELGYGNTNDIGDDELPSSVGPVSVGGAVAQIAAGNGHTCALLESGLLRCWGNGSDGQLGYGNTNNIGDGELPSSVGTVSVGGAVAQIAAGNAHTCALLSSGGLRCWGMAARGQLGYGNTNNIGDDELPSSVGTVSVGGSVLEVAANGNHTCVLLEARAIRCFGTGILGRLGYGNTNNIGDDELPSSVGTVSVGGEVAQIAAGSAHTCALLSSGALRCWGEGTSGQLGYGNTNHVGDDELPSSVETVSVGEQVVQVAGGGNHTCALLASGNLRCWGDGWYGQLGYGNAFDLGDDELPSSVDTVSVGELAVQIEAGAQHTCALLESGGLRCWGNGGSGQLGYGNHNDIGDNELPTAVGMVPYW